MPRLLTPGAPAIMTRRARGLAPAVVAAPAGPGGVSRGLVGWYKADTLAQADASAVAAWADSSGSGNTLSQATGSQQPTFRTAQINGLPVLRFDGVDDIFLLTSSILSSNATPYAVFAVTKVAANANYYTVWSTGTASGHSAALRSVYTVWELNHRVVPATDVLVDDPTTLVIGTPTLLGGIWDGANAILRRDGTERARAAATTRDLGGTSVAFGANVYAGGYHYYPGDIGELALYTVALTGTEITTIEASLKTRWGIP